MGLKAMTGPLVLFAIALPLRLAAQRSVLLTTSDTQIALQATSQGPRLMSVSSGHKPAWRNHISEPLISTVESDGQLTSLHWELDRAESRVSATAVTYVYRAKSAGLRLSWQWTARAGSGPIEHCIRIENLGSHEVWLPLQDSFDFQFDASAGEPLQTMYVDKGMGKPSAIGTHEVPLTPGYRWEGKSTSYGRDQDAREVTPWFMVQRANATQDGWYAGIEFSGRTHLTLQRDAESLRGRVGLDPEPGPFRTRLLPHQIFATPVVFIGGFTNGADGLGNGLRPWIRKVLTNPRTWQQPTYPLLVNNSWGSGMQVDETTALRMLDDSAELGLEMFHVDAGWFRGVGDYYPSPVKFPHGLAFISEEAHRRGLKFGLWTDWAQAGDNTGAGALNVHDPKIRDWLVADVPPDWTRPDPFIGRTIDLGQPAAQRYARHEVNRIVTDYHLDMLEHDGYLVARNCSRVDHQHAVAQPPQMSTVQGSGILMSDASNSTDVSYHAVHAYYDIYGQIRRLHPNLLFEICNDGGRMVDFGSAAHGDYFSITDAYDPLSNRQAFYDASHLLPPAMLEDYVEKWPTPRLENFHFMLRSGMMGWLTVMQDTSAWTPEQHAAARADFALYKQQLRPLIRDADLYHVSQRPDGIHWDGIEYFDAKRGRGVLYAFRGTSADEPQHSFLLQGLRPGRHYRLQFTDHPKGNSTVTGRALMSKGIPVSLPVAQSSELVFLMETDH